jgi:T-complex protein 1 subunit eta
MDSTDILNKLRQKHNTTGAEGMWQGVDVLGGKIDNLMDLFVWEPEIVRINVLTAATEAACTILSVD